VTHLTNADLHCHSVVSDGTLMPEELAPRAKTNGVELWALTDHDEVGGQERAAAAARQVGLPYLTGTEISVTFANVTVHIVGLGFDPTDRALVNGLRQTRGGREERARQMGVELARAGIPGAFEGAMKYVGNPDLISRSHFARYIVETGTCASVDEVFRRYLVDGRPGYVPHRWARLADAVAWIRAAGGTAVMAHPGRYRLSDLCFDQLIAEFKDAGGEAIEVVSGSHTPDQYGEFAAVAQRFSLMASRGSDFHGPGESRHDLGSMPALPKSLRPVWHDWPEALALERR
jgi:predicted metal-dependent phosphoesterase TrpH